MERTLPMILQWDESFDIGSDTLRGVTADYKPPFPVTAKLNKLTTKVDRPELSASDIKKLETAMREKATKFGLSQHEALGEQRRRGQGRFRGLWRKRLRCL
jgi:hypothetical protein